MSQSISGKLIILWRESWVAVFLHEPFGGGAGGSRFVFVKTVSLPPFF